MVINAWVIQGLFVTLINRPLIALFAGWPEPRGYCESGPCAAFYISHLFIYLVLGQSFSLTLSRGQAFDNECQWMSQTDLTIIFYTVITYLNL